MESLTGQWAAVFWKAMASTHEICLLTWAGGNSEVHPAQQSCSVPGTLLSPAPKDHVCDELLELGVLNRHRTGHCQHLKCVGNTFKHFLWKSNRL